MMHCGQGAAGVGAVAAAHQVGILRITGLENLAAWFADGAVSPEPEAQGPALDQGRQDRLGPFAWSRHPLNFVPVPIFWLWPRMSTNLLAFNTAATAYLLLGSIHEESRLRKAFGPACESYQRSGISFYLPRTTHQIARSQAAIGQLQSGSPELSVPKRF
jgi:hypothetical protein